MSWRARDAVELLALPPRQKAVLAALASYAREPELLCWPSVASLCERSSLSERTVRRALRELEEEGWLELVAPGGGRRSSRWRLQLEPSQRGQAGRAEGPPWPGRGARLAPEKIREPEIELRRAARSASGSGQEERAVESDIKAQAQQVAAEWWESRHPRPVGKFPAARARVREALEAGWTAPEVARALATFGWVPDRPSLVRKLEAIARIDRARGAEEPVLDYEHNRRATDTPWSAPW